MAFSLAESLQRIGVAQATALELQKQTESAVGNVGKLLAVGVPVGQAKYISSSIAAKSISAAKLVAHGMPAEVAKVLAGVAGLPVNITRPVITGTARVGVALTLSNGTWESGTPLTYGPVWQVADTSGGTYATIPGANQSTYTPTAAQVGKFLRGISNASNAYGSVGSVSNPTVAIIAA